MSSIEQNIGSQTNAPADARLARTRQKVREHQIAALCAGSWFASLGNIIAGPPCQYEVRHLPLTI